MDSPASVARRSTSPVFVKTAQPRDKEISPRTSSNSSPERDTDEHSISNNKGKKKKRPKSKLAFPFSRGVSAPNLFSENNNSIDHSQSTAAQAPIRPELEDLLQRYFHFLRERHMVTPLEKLLSEEEKPLSVSLLLVLQHPSLCMSFFEFLCSCYSEENLAFWIEMELYKHATPSHEKEATAKEIKEKHLMPNAPHSISLDETAELLQSEDDLNFLSAQTRIFEIMAETNMRKFLLEDQFKATLAGLKIISPRKDRERQYTVKIRSQKRTSTGGKTYQTSTQSSSKDRKSRANKVNDYGTRKIALSPSLSPASSPSTSPVPSQSSSPTPSHAAPKSPAPVPIPGALTFNLPSPADYPQTSFVFPSALSPPLSRPSSPPQSVPLPDKGLTESRKRFITQVGTATVYDAFRKYLEKVFAAENILFWEEVQLYRKVCLPSQRKQKALHILSTFLSPEAPYALHVDDGEVYQSIRTTLNSLKNSATTTTTTNSRANRTHDPNDLLQDHKITRSATSPPVSRAARAAGLGITVISTDEGEGEDSCSPQLTTELFNPLESGVLETLLYYLHGKFLPLYNSEQNKKS